MLLKENKKATSSSKVYATTNYTDTSEKRGSSLEEKIDITDAFLKEKVLKYIFSSFSQKAKRNRILSDLEDMYEQLTSKEKKEVRTALKRIIKDIGTMSFDDIKKELGEINEEAFDFLIEGLKEYETQDEKESEESNILSIINDKRALDFYSGVGKNSKKIKEDIDKGLEDKYIRSFLESKEKEINGFVKRLSKINNPTSNKKESLILSEKNSKIKENKLKEIGISNINYEFLKYEEGKRGEADFSFNGGGASKLKIGIKEALEDIPKKENVKKKIEQEIEQLDKEIKEMSKQNKNSKELRNKQKQKKNLESNIEEETTQRHKKLVEMHEKLVGSINTYLLVIQDNNKKNLQIRNNNMMVEIFKYNEIVWDNLMDYLKKYGKGSGIREIEKPKKFNKLSNIENKYKEIKNENENEKTVMEKLDDYEKKLEEIIDINYVDIENEDIDEVLIEFTYYIRKIGVGAWEKNKFKALDEKYDGELQKLNKIYDDILKLEKEHEKKMGELIEERQENKIEDEDYQKRKKEYDENYEKEKKEMKMELENGIESFLEFTKEQLQSDIEELQIQFKKDVDMDAKEYSKMRDEMKDIKTFWMDFDLDDYINEIFDDEDLVKYFKVLENKYIYELPETEWIDVENALQEKKFKKAHLNIVSHFDGNSTKYYFTFSRTLAPFQYYEGNFEILTEGEVEKLDLKLEDLGTEPPKRKMNQDESQTLIFEKMKDELILLIQKIFTEEYKRELELLDIEIEQIEKLIRSIKNDKNFFGRKIDLNKKRQELDRQLASKQISQEIYNQGIKEIQDLQARQSELKNKLNENKLKQRIEDKLKQKENLKLKIDKEEYAKKYDISDLKKKIKFKLEEYGGTTAKLLIEDSYEKIKKEFFLISEEEKESMLDNNNIEIKLENILQPYSKYFAENKLEYVSTRKKYKVDENKKFILDEEEITQLINNEFSNIPYKKLLEQKNKFKNFKLGKPNKIIENQKDLDEYKKDIPKFKKWVENNKENKIAKILEKYIQVLEKINETVTDKKLTSEIITELDKNKEKILNNYFKDILSEVPQFKKKRNLYGHLKKLKIQKLENLDELIKKFEKEIDNVISVYYGFTDQENKMKERLKERDSEIGDVYGLRGQNFKGADSEQIINYIMNNSFLKSTLKNYEFKYEIEISVTREKKQKNGEYKLKPSVKVRTIAQMVSSQKPLKAERSGDKFNLKVPFKEQRKIIEVDKEIISKRKEIFLLLNKLNANFERAEDMVNALED